MSSESSTQNPPEHDWNAIIMRDRVSLAVGSILCLAITIWLSRLFDVPDAVGRSGSLLQQLNWPVAIGLIWIVVIGGAVLASLIASGQHYDGGLFCACVGLAPLAARLGPSRYALFAATSPIVYLAMSLELVLLFGGITLAWGILRAWRGHAELPADQAEEPLDQKLLATAAQVIVSIILMMVLSQTDMPAQSLAAVGISSWLAALAAHHFVPTSPSAWFWAGPLIVGLIGYISQYFGPTDWVIGDARGFFGPLARPLPLDYASLGTAGALLGYWTSQRWQKDHSKDQASE